MNAENVLQLQCLTVLSFLPLFKKYEAKLNESKDRSLEDKYIGQTVRVLIDYLESDYRATLKEVRHLTSHGEITAELLWSILVPKTILLIKCPITGEPMALQLKSVDRPSVAMNNDVFVYTLICENIDALDSEDPLSRGIGRVQHKIMIAPFKGTVRIDSLDAYPLDYHPQAAFIRKSLIARGQKWLSLGGVAHKDYRALGATRIPTTKGNTIVKINVGRAYQRQGVTDGRFRSRPGS